MDSLLLAWLERLARSPLRSAFTLRGSLVTAHYCPERAAADIDLLGEGSFDAARARREIEAITNSPGAGVFDIGAISHTVIWAETSWPGLRTIVPGVVEGRAGTVQIDLGYGDPVVAPTIHMPIGDASVRAVRAETMFGWKVHGLFEFGRGQWRPKDLYDLDLLGRSVALDEALVVASTRVAFESRNTPLWLADRFVHTDEWGRSRGSQRRWEWFERRSGFAVDPLPNVIARVKERLIPIFSSIAAPRPTPDRT